MRISPDDPRYDELTELNMMLVLLNNPTVHYNTQDIVHEDKYYVNSVIQEIKGRIQEILDDNNPFISFVNGLTD
jgi:hypothetical protein